MQRFATTLGILVCAALWAALILAMPLNEYEWMLADSKAVADGLSFCGLPLDGGPSIRLVSLLLLSPLALIALVLSVRQRRFHGSAMAVLALLLVWGWRFLIHYPICPAPVG